MYSLPRGCAIWVLQGETYAALLKAMEDEPLATQLSGVVEQLDAIWSAEYGNEYRAAMAEMDPSRQLKPIQNRNSDVIPFNKGSVK